MASPQLHQPAVPPKDAVENPPPNSGTDNQPLPLPTPVAAVDPAQDTPAQNFFTIAICGGGIAGLALAIGLLHRNVPFQLYESHSDFAEVGAGFVFGSNALSAMSLIDPQIKEGYDTRCFRHKDGKGYFFEFYSGMDSGLGKAGRAVGTVGREDVKNSGIQRKQSMDELAALVPHENVTFGKKVSEVEELEDGVRLHFADGGTAEASAAVGCDGIKSNLRQYVLGKEDRATYPAFTGSCGLAGRNGKKTTTMWLGPHGHLVTTPMQRGHIIAAAIKQKKDGNWEDGRWVKPVDRAAMEGDFEDWGETVKKVTTLMEPIDTWALFDHPPAKTFNKGRTCLSGDAAHASTPHQAAGAGMALEDAYIMSGLLAAVQRSSDIESAFRAFDAVRRPRTQKLVSTSREAGGLYALEAEGVGDDPDKVREQLLRRYDWIWDANLEEHLAEAMGLMGEKA